ncbi:LOW QUALITY PROTEIN: hypothetical protein NC651_020402 [Populus alba x Populus x berolinensis]|nr:LOW QUALITY PROTEIN: hypothetical protein NC651_020402 [Populus alba x Populus x berolinensis]
MVVEVLVVVTNLTNNTYYYKKQKRLKRLSTKTPSNSSSAILSFLTSLPCLTWFCPSRVYIVCSPIVEPLLQIKDINETCPDANPDEYMRGGGATGKREMASVTSNEPNIHYSSFISYTVSLRTNTTVDRVEDGAADGIECAVHNGFGGGRDFLGDWFGFFRFYCFHSLLCCFHLQRQECLLIRLSTIQWCFYFLTKRCVYNVDDLFLAEAVAL